ncbi:MAG TPA: GNAT family N-acetyltransferase [Candidatus Limnocylindrales bacterium]|jgi:ribosomal protein S18 acetylase RimI-like enzyme|nr:GNAT family N-acetyltransferase [Candidatus Limnocylindrales bacterium]
MVAEIRVRPARHDEIRELAGVLMRAFEHDPFFSYLAGPASERRQRMRDGWNGILRYASARLAHTWTTDDIAGVALWLPPGYRPSLIDNLRLVPEMARFAGWRRLRLVTDALEVLEERRRRHVDGPHYYLSALGVEPTRQGAGIGTALMRPVLDRCDAEGAPAYLETATARNVLLYERVGFEVVEELTLPKTDIRGWLMRRPPAADRQVSSEVARYLDVAGNL